MSRPSQKRPRAEEKRSRPNAAARDATARAGGPSRAAGAGSTGWLPFTRVATEGPVSAIERRLRTAVALGILADGERLPREADLARQLGVTVFALREALNALREQGIIVTRPGNRGGSFVRRGVDTSRLRSAELRRISTSELLDLGEWRHMLTTRSAGLAARLAPATSVARLRRLAAALREASTEFDARTAHGRFHLELGAAAQSRRLTEAQMAMYEEYDWLLGLALTEPQWRDGCVSELEAIADAVESGDVAEAQAAAAQHSSSTLATLNRLRLAAIAAEMPETSTERLGSPDQLAAEVDRLIGDALQWLTALAVRTAELARGDIEARSLLAGMAGVAIAGLVNAQLKVDGVGFLAEVALVPGHEYWIPWWHRTPDGFEASSNHVVDPSRDDFYDYTTMECFSIPRETGDPFVQGPYIDYGGANDYILTLSVPATVGGRFIGTATADLQVGVLEQQLAPWLVSDTPLVLVNRDGRVVLSSDIDLRVGDLLRRPVARSVEIPTAGWAAASIDLP